MLQTIQVQGKQNDIEELAFAIKAEVKESIPFDGEMVGTLIFDDKVIGDMNQIEFVVPIYYLTLVGYPWYLEIENYDYIELESLDWLFE